MAAPFAAACLFWLRLSLCPDGIAAPPAARVERRLSAMGTLLSLSVSGASRSEALLASEAAAREIARIENLLSTWKRGGSLDRLNRAPVGERVELGAEAFGLLREVFAWNGRTREAFDPTVLPLVRAFDLRGAGRQPDAEELARARQAAGPRCFALDAASQAASRLCPEAGIDEGAWGKGYALDRAAAALGDAGTRDALLDLGGQILSLGPSRVMVADPRNRSRAAVTLEVAGGSVSTSGNSERGVRVGGVLVGHLLDPRTGRPAADFGSATAVAPTGFVADVLSTAFFVLGPEEGLALSEQLRREGIENRALFLVVRGTALEVLASPGLGVIRREE